MHAQRLHRREDDHWGDLAVHRAHPARPLHRGHLPDLRLRRRPRRPVRQLRQPARPGRPDQPAQPDQRRDAEVRRDRALLPRPARRSPRRSASWLQAAQRLAAQRAEVLAEPARRPPAPGDHPGHRLGHPDPAARAGRTTRTSGSTSGSTRSSATCRRRSSGPAARGDPEAWRRVVAGPGGRARTTSWARTTSSSTPRSGRPSCSATTGAGAHGGDAGRARRAQPAHRGGLQRVPDHGGQQVLLLPRRSSSTCATSSPATSPTRCATSSPWPARRPRTPTSPGRSSCGAPTTSWSPAGATWSTARSRWSTKNFGVDPGRRRR